MVRDSEELIQCSGTSSQPLKNAWMMENSKQVSIKAGLQTIIFRKNFCPMLIFFEYSIATFQTCFAKKLVQQKLKTIGKSRQQFVANSELLNPIYS